MSYSYNEAFNSSLGYFDGDDLAAKVFVDKYALRDNDGNLLEKTPACMHSRIASELARIESKKFKKPLSFDQIYSYLDRFNKIVPQGSLLYGIGNNHQYVSLSNCYVLSSPVDSYGGIHKADEELSHISKRRGGVGIDISHIRPAGVITKNAARTSTGIIPFMERFSNSIREVGQGGRRGALMITISVHHPQVIDFATIKRDLTKVTGANISVRLTDEFLHAVETDSLYEQRFPVDSAKPTISIKVPARDVWRKIIENAHYMAEPGLLFWDTIIKESPADCYSKFGFDTQSTNPCSELPLSPNDSCRLLLENLFSYVKNPFCSDAYFDFDEFYKDSKIAQRLMDDIIDLELEAIERIIEKIKKDPEKSDVKERELQLWNNIKNACFNGRRTGTGITALGDALAALNIKYGSEESIKFTEKVYKNLKLACYRSSVEMAKELGAFPVWDHELEKNNPFLLRMKEEDPGLYDEMRVYGRRNIALLTTAPAGSVSIETQTSSGIEPIFMTSYKRRKKVNPLDENCRIDFTDQNGDSWQEFTVHHPKLKTWMEVTGETDISKSPYHGCCAEDLDWQQRVKLQAAAHKHVDHSISSTINLSEDTPVEKVAKIYETAWKSGCKGITVYRKNCRTGVLVDEATKRGNKIQKTTAPNRTKDLECDIHHITSKGTKYFVLVGLLKNDPYELFAGVCKELYECDKGLIHKAKRGAYQLMCGDKVLIESITDHCDDHQEALTRMTSTALRHGADIKFIVHQLEKTKGDMQSFAKAVSRVLKKYVPDGTLVDGEQCGNCNGTSLRREAGCIICPDCGWSKC